VLGKIGTCKAIKVAHTPANGAFLVEVILAITLRSDVLVKRSAPLATVKFTQDVNVAQFTQVAIEAALSGGSFLVYFLVELVHRKLAVGVASKKAEERFPARCLISLFSHGFLLKLRTVLKLYHKNRGLSSPFLF
jgi:hypothetical protein